MAKPYTASKSLTKDGTSWILSFRHPLKKDAQGKQGRKMRRGLGKLKEEQAQSLVDEMNDLLSDPTWHNPAKRTEAERRYDSVVVRAFFDDLESVASNSWEIRGEALPLPSRKEGYVRTLLVGATGVGKTSALRQLIGSHPERDRFPSTSASRTTIADIEVIASDDPTYRAVVTFFNEQTVHTYVHECVADACAVLWDEQVSDERLAERLLTHRDLRFRLGYIIGTLRQLQRAADASDGWSDDESASTDALGEEGAPDDEDLERMRVVLMSFLTRVRAIAGAVKGQTELKFGSLDALSGAEKDQAQDEFENDVQEIADFDELVGDVMDEIRLRFRRLESEQIRQQTDGWPVSWTYESSDRDEFLRVIRRFSTNDARAFGTLLTPLVDGIRVRGRFSPAFGPFDERLVLIDGEGIGHVGDSSAGVSSRVTRRFADVDVILLVDSAKSPMLDAPTSVLRAVTSTGNQHKLAFAFTHFDLMKGQANLPKHEDKVAHVLAAVRQKLAEIREQVGPGPIRAIERDLPDRCFMLGLLDKQLDATRHRGPVGEILRMLRFFRTLIEPRPETDAQAELSPKYDSAGLVLAIIAAATDFHKRWNSILGHEPSAIARTAHWAEIKALNRRVVLGMDNREYKDLKPAADLFQRLSEAISRFLGHPVRWEPVTPSDIEAEQKIALVQQSVAADLLKFAESILLLLPIAKWGEAFNFRQSGSTTSRARSIRAIYDQAAPIPSGLLDQRTEHFMTGVRRVVHRAVRRAGGEFVNEVLDVEEENDAPVLSPSDAARETPISAGS
jgi:hypothetical protein